MSTTLLRRKITTPLLPFFSLHPHIHPFSTTTPPPPPQPPQQPPPPHPSSTSSNFQTLIHNLKPPFTPTSITAALTSQPDPDLAYDIFRWTSHHRHYHHDATTYLTILKICITHRRHRLAETLLDEILAGGCSTPITLPLYNTLIDFCCSHRCLFKRSFDVYKHMINKSKVNPNLETYRALFRVLIKRFNGNSVKLNVGFVYLNVVKSLVKQMKVYGVVPDTFVLNMIIKANARCLMVDEAVRVFKEMGLYGCEPNGYSFSYLVKGCCEKGRVGEGLGFYREMRGRGFIGTSGAGVVLVCGLALERRFDEAREVVRDLLRNGLRVDLLTYRTLVEEMCREGKGVEALEMVEEFRGLDVSIGERAYKTLLDCLHFVDR